MCICICICICADIDMTSVFAANCQLAEETQHTLDSSQFAQLTIPQLRLNWKSHKSPSKGVTQRDTAHRWSKPIDQLTIPEKSQA